MVLPVSILLIAGLLLYAGLHDMTVTDALGQLLGRKPSSTLGSLSGAPKPGANATGSGPVTLGGTSVPNHPELRSNVAQVVNAILQAWPKLQITSTIGGTHAHASYHYFGEAADLGGDPAYMKQAADWIATNLTSELTEGIHNPNLSVKNGKSVNPSFWGSSTWSEHVNHIHIAVAQNQVSSPPGF